MKEVLLNFHGYTWEEYAHQIISHSGIYIVYGGEIDAEGFVKMSSILYVGFHNGMSELYDNGIIESIKEQLNNNKKLFFSYSSIPSDVNGKDIELILKNSLQPRFPELKINHSYNMKLICKGNCDLIPSEIIG